MSKFKPEHPDKFAEGEQVSCQEHPDKELFFVKATKMQPKGFVVQLQDTDCKNYWVNHIGKHEQTTNSQSEVQE